MDILHSNHQSDELLEAVLGESGHWVVNGQQGQVICFAPNLRRALDRAAEYAASGAVVVAIRRLPFDNIVVFPAQIDRLRKGIAGREPMPIMETQAGPISRSADDRLPLMVEMT